MLDLMYDLPSRPDVRECVITEEVVIGDREPILVYENDSANWA
jgi:ATP-dependent Clp protease ATP-binding subunit ClpX